MSDKPEPLHPLVWVGMLIFVVGCLAGIWLADWRPAVSGVLVAFLFMAMGVTAKPKSEPPTIEGHMTWTDEPDGHWGSRG